MSDTRPAAPQPDDARERLRQHFLHDRTPNRWNELWQKGDFLPWDRGVPNPALSDALKYRASIIGQPLHSDGRRKRALVPGCGKGYDVLLLAAAGYDAIGLDLEDAIQQANSFAIEAWGRKEYDVWDERIGRGELEFVDGDFYKEDWEKEVGEGGFDVIYDYTFLCAMPPNLRPAWSKRITELLAPGGTLICLEFPLYKDPSTGGPPFGLSAETYEMLLPFPGEEPAYDDKGYVLKRAGREPSATGLVRAARWKAERTHPVGQGTDHVSLWKHAGDDGSHKLGGNGEGAAAAEPDEAGKTVGD